VPQIVTLGEILVEMVATVPDQGFRHPGTFAGPYPSGAPAIFIDQAARMGASTAMLGCVGADDFGRCVLDRLSRDGVDVGRIRAVPDVATGVAFVSYNRDGSRGFIFHMGNSAAGRLSPDDIDAAAFEGCQVLHVMGSSLFSPEMGEVTRRAVALATDAGARLSFDPNVRVELLNRPGNAALIQDLAARADILLPSEADLQFLRPGVDAVAAARAFLDGRAECVFLKRGAAGSTYLDRTTTIEVPAFTVTEVDPTGAGDCAGATFVACRLQGRAPADAARRANAAGALAVTKRGPMEGNSTPAELDAFLAGRR
jgi:sugar/nucleoside kinase (ribokinase family)